MPHIMIKGIESDEVKKISKAMLDELESIVGCPKEYFTLEVQDSKFIVDGEIIKKDPFIQINWFDRGQEIQDQVAVAITKHIYNAGLGSAEIFFTILERNNYYEDGKHL